MNSNHFMEKILENCPDAVIAFSPEGTVIFWNRGAEKIFGYRSEEALGFYLNDLMVPSDRIDEENKIRSEVMRTGLFIGESIRIRKDGSLLSVHISTTAVRDEMGEVEYLLTVKKDITSLKVEREAKLIEAKYRDLLESMPDAIIIVNNTGRMILITGQALRLFGYEGEELIGQPVERLLPPRYHSAHVRHRAHFFVDLKVRPMGVRSELFGLRKDGAEFPVGISLSPLATEEGVLVISAIRDISDRKRIEQALQQKNLELEQASRAKDRFLASMSHELRTPLNSILGFTGTMLMGLPGPLTEDQESQLKTVESNAIHLLSLINDLLDLAKIESGKIYLQFEPVSYREVIQDVAGILRPLAENKGLQLELECPPEDLVLMTDRRALRQIILNLTNNAIKFTELGEVCLEVAQTRSNGRLKTEISVTDTGIGIREEDQARLFEAFSPSGGGTGQRRERPGLGLHLSRKLAELIQGRIIFNSEYGKGSKFTLILEEN